MGWLAGGLVGWLIGWVVAQSVCHLWGQLRHDEKGG